MKITILGVRDKTEEKTYRTWVHNVLKKVSKRIPVDTDSINIIIVSDHYIHKLNKQFLNRDYPTDVLAFPIQEKLWGEIYISKDRAARQAKEQKIDRTQEICNLISHGILHLACYSHDEMEKVLKSINA